MKNRHMLVQRLPLTQILLCAVLPLMATGCQKSKGATVDAGQLQTIAQYYVDHGGLAFNGSNLKHPCLRGVSLKNTLLGGISGDSVAVVDFIDHQGLATVTRTPSSPGYTKVTITPKPEFKDQWINQGTSSYYCFGKLTVTTANAVADAQAITAGAEQPYLVPGTKAQSVRITFKVDDVLPEQTAALKATPNVLVSGSIQPDEFDQEKTVVAVLPSQTTNFQIEQ